MTPRPRFLPRSGELLILIAIGVLVLIAVTDNWSRIIDLLYGPVTAAVAVIMLVEYVVLKGADRSRIYQRELQGARQRRKEDLLALRDLESRLLEWRAELKTASAPETELERIDAMLKTLRERS